MKKYPRYFMLTALLFSNMFAQMQLHFQIDMRVALKHQIFNPLQGDTLVVRGNFNGWQGNKAFLTDADNDSIYSFNYELRGFEGDILEYKFVICRHGGNEIWEQNPAPDNPPYGNRKILLSEVSHPLAVVSFDLDKYSIDGQFKFSAVELQEDYLQFIETIRGLHPALYAFSEKMVLDSIFEAQRKFIQRPQTGAEFYHIVAPQIARIGCGHTGLRMPENWWFNQPDRFFPLKIHYLNDIAYVLQSSGDTLDIPPGSKIRSINGLAMETIIEEILATIPADGYNRGYRVEHLNDRFPYLYALQYGFPEQFRITYQAPGEEAQQTAELPPVTGKIVAAGNPWNPVLNFEVFEEKSSAILTINNFNYYEAEEKFYQYIDESFDSIQTLNIQNLILDLRGNEGGDPFCAAYLLSYVAPEPVSYFAEPYGKYADLAQPLPPAKKRFEGKLFTLINGKCFSTTGHLCSLLKYHHIGTLIGSETGGTYSCNDAKVFLPLKNTNLLLQVAQRSFATAVRGMSKDCGILPDIPVNPKIEDLIAGKDRVKEFTLSLIDKQSNGE